MKTFDLTFAGGETLRVPGGKYFRVLDASADLEIRVLDRTAEVGSASGVRGGYAFRRELGFDAVAITSAAAQTIKVATSRDAEIDYDRTTGEVSITPASGLVSTADVSLAATATTLISAANTSRREILVSNLAANTATLRIGDSNTSAARGVELAPGQTITLSTTAAVYGYNPGAAAQSVGVVEVTG